MIDTKQVELKSKALADFQFSMKHYLTHFSYAKVSWQGILTSILAVFFVSRHVSDVVSKWRIYAI